ncbi:MAG: aldo/keto reductase [Lachnospiraceae bacterium]|nr:aldo/keto reductase [Lachnospiraceae bacterium]
MKQITLGKTGITVPQNAFGALPIQRVTLEEAVRILRRAYEGGMRFFDTARNYSDSEEKIGAAFGDTVFAKCREEIYIATNTHARTPEEARKDLATSLNNLRTDYIDIYQLHCAPQVFAPGDGTGMYEFMQEAKAEGKIRHISMSAHKIGVAVDAVKSGLYETMQFPFSYISTKKELELVDLCREHQVGFIAMKGLAGGLINRSDVAMAFIAGYDNVLPIWGVQKMSELEEWLSYMDETPVMNEEMASFIEKEREDLSGDFCRGCGYCLPCPAGIPINQCARMSVMLRRAPSASWLTPHWQEEMKKIENCIGCRQCASRCPYELDTPELLKRNYEDYKKVLAGEVSVQ